MPHRTLLRATQLALALLAGAYLLYFLDHARRMLGFPYPIDYGEGPLVAQVEALLAGTPIWQLYGDPQAAPYLIVNYPPLYLLLTAALAPFTGSTLLAGRLLSLLATIGSVVALTLLARPRHGFRLKGTSGLHPSSFILHPSSFILLTVPIVREWAVLMRVDMLGVCLGLWGLVVLTRAPIIAPARAGAAALLLAACLFTKPSLLAAPGAAVAWLAWRALRAPAAERRPHLVALVTLTVTTGLLGGLLFALLQWASSGWFALHVVAANANLWDRELALGFWRQQLALRWPLAAAAALSVGCMLWRGRGADLALPALYTLLGALTAAGVGKVGAYSNYFLELYAGLVWVIAASSDSMQMEQERRARWLAPASCLLLAASLVYYPPLWDATRLRPAGLIEPSPPRLAFGRYGLWADARREAELLAAQARVGAALTAEVRAAGPAIFTDMPGVAAAAGVTSRLQAFEARQLLDQGLASEGELLRELANGAYPLAVIDYLGNWLTPGAIEILQRRYAHDGAIGTFDLYRPVETGPPQPLDLDFSAASGLRLSGYSLAGPAGQTYEPGETLALTLHWRRSAGKRPAGTPTVVLQLTTTDGTPILADERRLLYGAFPPSAWPDEAELQHMQPLTLPAELPDGRYALAVGLRQDDQATGAAQVITTLDIASQGGAWFEETGHFVPARLMRAWAELGGLERAGAPLTPAVPFAWGRLQCFERSCLELRGDEVRQRPLGERLYLAETIRGEGCGEGAPDASGLCPGFSAAGELYAELGRPISGELPRNGWLVQWTEAARLERAERGESPGLGRLGDESLRLPPGTPYRWP